MQSDCTACVFVHRVALYMHFTHTPRTYRYILVNDNPQTIVSKWKKHNRYFTIIADTCLLRLL